MARIMKESGLEWVGKIPENWEVKRNKQLFYEVNERCERGDDYTLLSVSEYTGVTPRRDIIEDGEFETHAKSLDGYKLCLPGDIVMNIMLAWKRATATSDYTGIVSPAYCVFRGYDDVDTKYFHYLFRTDNCADMFKRFSSGIIDSRLRLYPNVFLSLNSIVPPLDEQKRVSSYLDSECARIDEVIEKTRASIEEYKKLKQSVITQAVTKGIRPDREMKDSDIEWIGKMPNEWAVRPLKAFVDILPGYAFSSDDFDTESGIPLLRGINVTPNGIRWGETVYWNQPLPKQLKQFELCENDLVFGLDRPWISEGTRVAFITKECVPSLLLQRVCRIRAKCNMDIRFVYHVIAGESFKEALSTDTTGISVPHISTKQIQNYILAVPSLREQIDICDYLDRKCMEIDELIAKKRSLLTELESYKKAIIFEYVTGKRAVRD